MGDGGITDVPQWHNTTAVNAWVKKTVDRVMNLSIDGFNIDIEVPCSTTEDAAALTALSKAAATAMHAAKPWSHVTYDIPSGGMAGGCGKQYGRE
jgi:hypothetical protein